MQRDTCMFVNENCFLWKTLPFVLLLKITVIFEKCINSQRNARLKFLTSSSSYNLTGYSTIQNFSNACWLERLVQDPSDYSKLQIMGYVLIDTWTYNYNWQPYVAEHPRSKHQPASRSQVASSGLDWKLVNSSHFRNCREEAERGASGCRLEKSNAEMEAFSVLLTTKSCLPQSPLYSRNKNFLPYNSGSEQGFKPAFLLQMMWCGLDTEK